MLGMGVSNFGIFRRRLEYFAVPMYGFKDKEIAGSASLNYQLQPVKTPFQTITIGSTFDRYALKFVPNFTRITGSVKIRFKEKGDVRSTLKKDLIFRHVMIDYALPQFFAFKRSNFNVLNFVLTNSHVLKPWTLNAEVQQSKTFVKSSITYDRFIPYDKRKKGLSLRAFGGAFLYKSNEFGQNLDVRFRLSGQNGPQDYLYDNIYLGRQESTGVLSRQMTISDAAFTLPTYLGQADIFMTALNLKTSLPSKIPFKLYANWAYFAYNEYTYTFIDVKTTTKTDFAAEAGVSLPLISNNFEIFFPLVYTKNLGDAFKFSSSNLFEQRIRFTLNIKLFNPMGAIRNLGS
jgi:hypothetical protein